MGLPGTWDWQTGGTSLQGVFDLLAEGWPRRKRDAALQTFLARLRDYADQGGFTIASQTRSDDSGLSVFFQIDSDDDLEAARKSGKLDKLSQQFVETSEQVLSKRRPKRSKNDLPDPSQPHSAGVNRYTPLTTQFKADIDPDLASRAEAFRKAAGMKKRDLVEEALRLYLDQQEPS